MRRLLIMIPLCACIAGLPAGCDDSSRTPSVPGGKPRQQAPHLVEDAVVTRMSLPYASVRTGTLTARREVRIFNQEEGRITQLPWYEGDRVDAGATLATLDATLLQAQLVRASATLRQARQDLERLRRLSASRSVSEEQLTRAETAVDVARAEAVLLETRIGYMSITAPFDGVVSERNVEVGDAVPRHTHLLTVLDPDSLVAEVPVSELLLTHLRVDDTVQVRIDALGRQQFQGRILRVHPQVDPLTRRGTVEIVLDPVPPGARAGQLARITLGIDALAVLAVPLNAVQRDRDGEYVFRLHGDGTVSRTPVRTGTRLGSEVEALEGVAEGQRVVTKGFLGLKDGMTVESVTEPASGTADGAGAEPGRVQQ